MVIIYQHFITKSIIKYNNKVPTLIIIKTKLGFKFEGYTTKTWELNGIKKKDESTFLFSLNNKKKYNIKNEQIQNAIYGNNSYFAFGDGFDLSIYDQCTLKNYSYCSSCSFNTTEKYELNGGQKNFYVDELEVYHVEFE